MSVGPLLDVWICLVKACLDNTAWLLAAEELCLKGFK